MIPLAGWSFEEPQTNSADRSAVCCGAVCFGPGEALGEDAVAEVDALAAFLTAILLAFASTLAEAKGTMDRQSSVPINFREFIGSPCLMGENTVQIAQSC